MSLKKLGVKYLPYKLYIPENLIIDELLRQCPPTFKRKPKKFQNVRDATIYIVHLINSIPQFQKDFDYEKARGFVPINKVFLRNRIHEYRALIEYLIEQGVILEGTSYRVGERSRGLKFTPLYMEKVKPIKIYTSTLIKSILTGDFNSDKEAEAKLFFLKKWYNPNLTIDYDKALAFLEEDKDVSAKKIIEKRSTYTVSELSLLPSIKEVVIMGYNSKFITVDKIFNADYRGYLKIDLTTGRFHSPLTQLKKPLRKQLRYNGEKLANIDIVNSQPLMALIVLDIEIFERLDIKNLIAKYNPNFKVLGNPNNQSKSFYTMLVKMIKENCTKQDVILYKKAVTLGTFYETFSTILWQQGLLPQEILSIPNQQKRDEEIRVFAKIATFRAFFEKRHAAKWNEYVRAFKQCFPNVFSIFQLVKTGDGYHNTLACIFQRFESDLILHKICMDLHYNVPHIPIFTIHDSIATTQKFTDLVKLYFEKHLYLRLGVKPRLNVEVWE